MIPYLNRLRRSRKRKRKFKPGYDRTGGFYGRFRKRRKRNNTERKFYDLTLAGDVVVPQGPAFPTLNGAGPNSNTSTLIDISQGTGESQRIGRKCTITSIHVRFIFLFKNAGETTYTSGLRAHETTRIVLYQDKQCNGQAITGSDLLKGNKLTSFRNIANSARFRILVDKTFDFNTTASAAGNGTTNVSQQNHKNKKCYFSKIVNIPIEYSATTGALTELRSNNIGLLTWSMNGYTSLDNDSRIRIRFIDK